MRPTSIIAAVTAVAVAASIAPAASADVHDKAEPGKRLITMAAVELKGGVTVDKEPFPTQPLPEGAGYVLKAPDNTGRWEVSTYRWEPAQVVVAEGDDVTLEIVGINGKEHPSVIEGYGVEFSVMRGQLTTVAFKADKPGVFRIICKAHPPSMQGELIVLPRS